MSDLSRILLVLLLVLGNAVFVAAEYALVASRRAFLQERSEAGSRGANRALKLMNTPVLFISTVQVAITVCAIAMGAIGEPLISHFFEPYLSRTLAFVVSFLILTYLSVTLGELVPKAIALQRAERLAVTLAYPIDLLGRILAPVVWLLQTSANAVARLFGVRPEASGILARSREDIRLLVTEAGQTGLVEGVEQEMLYGAFKFADKEVHDVMVPRPEVVAISVDLPAQECLAAVIDSPYTRYPAYAARWTRSSASCTCATSSPPSTRRGSRTWRWRRSCASRMSSRRRRTWPRCWPSSAGRTSTWPSSSTSTGRWRASSPSRICSKRSSARSRTSTTSRTSRSSGSTTNTVRIGGTFPIDDFNEQFEKSLPVDDYHTLGGFVFGLLGRAPELGDEVEYDGLRFEVAEVEGSRIDRLTVTFVELPPEERSSEELAAEG